MKKYKVNLTWRSYCTATIEVDSDTRANAAKKALEEAKFLSLDLDEMKDNASVCLIEMKKDIRRMV